MRYYECPNCGASLDLGEKCDCEIRQSDNIGEKVKTDGYEVYE